MEKKNNKIEIFLIFAFIIWLLISGTQPFIRIPLINLELTTYEIKGFKIVLVGMMFYLHAFYTKKKWSLLLANIACVFGYAYTIYSLITSFSNIDNASAELLKFDLGAYMYLLSFCFFIISDISSIKRILFSNKKEMNDNTYLISNHLHYLLANYVYGLEKSGDLYNKLTILSFSEEATQLQIDIESSQFGSIIIPINSITNMSAKNTLVVKEVSPPIENNEMANSLLLTALFGTWGPMISESKLLKDIGDYNKTKMENIFELEINYIVDNQNKKLLFQTKQNPQKFINSVLSCKQRI